MINFKRLSILALALALLAFGAFAASPTDITTGAQTATGTGALTGTLDMHALSGNFTLKVQVTSLTCTTCTSATNVKIVLEDSVNAFTASIPVAVVDVSGPIAGSGVTYSIPWYQVPSLRLGVSSAVLRANVYSYGTNVTGVTVHAWIEQ